MRVITYPDKTLAIEVTPEEAKQLELRPNKPITKFVMDAFRSADALNIDSTETENDFIFAGLKLLETQDSFSIAIGQQLEKDEAGYLTQDAMDALTRRMGIARKVWNKEKGGYV
jgi:hypothetical protein